MKLIIKEQVNETQEPVVIAMRQRADGIIVEAEQPDGEFICTVMQIGNDGRISFPLNLAPLKELGFKTTKFGIITGHGINP